LPRDVQDENPHRGPFGATVEPTALDQAAAQQGWKLPEVFQHMRHLLVVRMGNCKSARGSGTDRRVK
jgi:hypothetical protein